LTQRPRRTAPISDQASIYLQRATTQARGFIYKEGFTPASVKFDMSAFGNNPDCEYVNPCGNLLRGRVRYSPELGSFNVNEILNREWLPQMAVQVVCELDRGQEKSLKGDCEA
jgi:hypothetical protein